MAHYYGMWLSYIIVIGIWLLIYFRVPALRSTKNEQLFDKPWLELLAAFLAVVLILLIGQLYVNDLLLPKVEGFGEIIDAVNQTLIFSPVSIVLILRKHKLNTIWITHEYFLLRLLIGVSLGIFAFLIYSLLTNSFMFFINSLSEVYSFDNFSHFVQVFWEDVTIAFLFVRLKQTIGQKIALIVVPVLFTAAHIPALLSVGVSISEMSGLVMDALLGISLIWVLDKSRDILWFFPVHFTMDMTQFL